MIVSNFINLAKNKTLEKVTFYPRIYVVLHITIASTKNFQNNH
jgi:hypothetical protein